MYHPTFLLRNEDNSELVFILAAVVSDGKGGKLQILQYR